MSNIPALANNCSPQAMASLIALKKAMQNDQATMAALVQSVASVSSSDSLKLSPEALALYSGNR
jgi:hypothetical protein